MSDLLTAPPWWYWLVGGVVTAWQGVRGWYFQRRHAERQKWDAIQAPRIAALHRAQALAQIAFHLTSADPKAAVETASQATSALANMELSPAPESESAIRWLRCLEDLLLYAVSSAAGFVALWFAYRIVAALPSVNAASPGAATLLILLSTVGVVGAAGYLPHWITLAKGLR